jgi:CheY-like chemotaxis protein
MRSLVIDDEFVALTKLSLLLEPLGQCDAATSGHQGLELFKQALLDACPYNLVTIDINMPDFNGIALLGRLRREEQQRGAGRAKMLIATAASTTSNVLAAMTGECDGFLAKPIRRAVLFAKLGQIGLLSPAVAQQGAGQDDAARVNVAGHGSI